MQNNVSDASASKSHFEGLFDQLKGEFVHLSQDNAQLQKMVDTDLAAYKSAFASAEQEKAQLQALLDQREERIHSLEIQLRGYRISVIIDGDGAIFAPNFISHGRDGGHEAAHQLFDQVKRYLNTNFGEHSYQIWVYIFFNKRGLMEALGKSPLSQLKATFEDFVIGFNQASTQISMVDVGFGKEAADSKVKASLDRDVSLPQTFKVFFGGCHDNGYATSLRTLLTGGLGDKVVLLTSYNEMAKGLSELGLNVMTVPGLFMEQKLSTFGNHSVLSSTQDKGVNPNYVRKTDNVAVNLPSGSSSPSLRSPKAASNGKLSPRRQSISSSQQSPPPSPARPVLIPNLALNKQSPPPCTTFYLIGHCPFQKGCKYGHNYELSEQHIAELRSIARMSPCSFLIKGNVCTKGGDCIYGHKCPRGRKCPFLKQGRCKFSAADMHNIT
ncbi:hypothetical protein BDV98DRAFT_569434 [Pterulicium gracile]|uniref:C3H1-type domain-containing protein n=1 Tax=Pterulicium gracile TaxID=1884261 RepID=A0A5C3QKF0_9AGAR|nr:hypothetical protein BDV98DRAFT_569434 [Pterula gracilis]